MHRRTLLSRLGGGLAVATSTGLAGCPGAVRDFTECGDESDTRRQWDVDDKLTRSAVEGLTVVDHEATIECTRGVDRPFGITVTVENSGDGTVEDLLNYEFALKPFDGNGSHLTARRTSRFTAAGELDPGERGEVVVIKGDWEGDATPGDVARYELAVTCADADEAVYC